MYIYDGRVMFECAGWGLILLSAAFLIMVSTLVWLVFYYRRRLVRCRAERAKEIESLRSHFLTGIAHGLRTSGMVTGGLSGHPHPEEGKPAIPDVGDNRSNAVFINKLTLAVSSHLDDSSWFPAGLAREMCLSESQLNRKLKAMTGHTISSFVMWMRLDRARQMLSNRGGTGDTSIKEVAYACGFNSLPYFARSFKAEFGVPPSRFAQES